MEQQIAMINYSQAISIYLNTYPCWEKLGC